MRDVEQLRCGFTVSGQSVAEHRVAERARGGDGFCAGRDKFRGAYVAHTLASLFAEEGEATAGSATKAALVVARGFDYGSGQGCDGARLVVNIAIAAQLARVVEDDCFVPRSQSRDLGHPDLARHQ